MIALRNMSKQHIPRRFDRYIIGHGQSMSDQGVRWGCPGMQVVADGLVNRLPGGDFHIAALGLRNEALLAVGTVRGGGMLPVLSRL